MGKVILFIYCLGILFTNPLSSGTSGRDYFTGPFSGRDGRRLDESDDERTDDVKKRFCSSDHLEPLNELADGARYPGSTSDREWSPQVKICIFFFFFFF